MSTAPADAAAHTSSACYVYGIVPSDTHLPEGLHGVGDEADHVQVIAYDGTAALVSEIDPHQPLGTRNDLLAHERVLDTVALERATVPMQFGAVLSDAESVVTDLLAPHQEHFATILAELEGHVQFTVKGRFVEETVLSEVLAEEPEVRALRERTQEVPAEASYYDRIRLGELVVQALTHKREANGQFLLDTLAPHAAAVSVHDPGDEQELGKAAFLVPAERHTEFEDAVEKLAQHWDGRVRVRLLGPLAPYDFVDSEQDW